MLKLTRTTSKAELLSQLKKALEDEVSSIRSETSELKGRKDLSREIVGYNIEKNESSIENLEKLIAKVSEIQTKNQPAGLFLYHRKMGAPPAQKDPVYLASDKVVWSESKLIGFHSEFAGKKAGEKWSNFISRADDYEHFEIIAKY